jgi:mono/diheme cytochrome c family protein
MRRLEVRSLAYGLLALIAIAAAAQHIGKRDARIESDYTELSKAPTQAQTRRNPLREDTLAATAGRKLFLQHCAECHGRDADGGNKAPSLRADEVQQATPGTLFWLLSNGVVRRGMPVWSKLPEPQRWQIVSYIESLRSSAGPNGHR